jgi:hypothetical protein
MVMSEDVTGHRPSVIGVVNPKHASYTTSGLEFEVFPDLENEFIVEVEGVLKAQPPADAKHEH